MGQSTFLAGAIALAMLAQSSAASPQPLVRYKGCLYNPFRWDQNGNLFSTYSCDRSDIIGYGIAFNCVNSQLNRRVPDWEGTAFGKMPGSDGTPWKWTGWKSIIGAEEEALFWQMCKKYYR